MTAQDPWAPWASKYKIHAETYELLRQGVALGLKPYPDLGVQGAREQMLKVTTILGGEVDFDGEVVELFVPSPYSDSGIPVTVYKPAGRSEAPAILIYFHGGGLVIGSRQSHESTLKIIASDSKSIVINVEYRLLPDPTSLYAPFDDADVVTRWVLENKEAVGGAADSLVGLGGDSAGGQITAAVTNDIQGLDFQVLVYPLSDTSMSQDSFREFKQVPGLDEKIMNFFFDNAMRLMPDYLTNPRVNNMVRTNTELSPPALVILAELDPLLGCGLDYADKLKESGVPTEVHVIEGVPHAFFSLPKVFKTKSYEAYEHVTRFLAQYNH